MKLNYKQIFVDVNDLNHYLHNTQNYSHFITGNLIETFIALDLANLLDQPLEISTNSPSERYHEAYCIFGRYVGRRSAALETELTVRPSPVMNWKRGRDDLRRFAQLVRDRIGVGEANSNFLTYVRRSPNVLGRFYLNEEAVVRTLRDVADHAQLQFTDVRLEDHTFEFQVKLMAQTKVLVGLHGAAFANAMFCQPNSHIIQLWPNPKFKHGKFDAIGSLLHHSHTRLNVNKLAFPNLLSVLRLPLFFRKVNRHRIRRDRILLADTEKLHTEMCKILASHH